MKIYIGLMFNWEGREWKVIEISRDIAEIRSLEGIRFDVDRTYLKKKILQEAVIKGGMKCHQSAV